MVRAKGVKNCCCGGCGNVPLQATAGLPNTPRQYVDEVQQHCCACVPIQICVEYVCDADAAYSAALLDIERCNDTLGTNWSGSIPIDGSLHDIEFTFQVTAGVCYLTLNSTSLSITDMQVQMTADNRCILCQGCSPDNVCGKDHYLEFDISTEDTTCSGDSFFRVRRAGNVPIPRTDPCPECDENPYHEVRPCTQPCCSCKCICSQACITITDSSGATTETITVGNDPDGYYRWTTSGGVEIALTSVDGTADGACQLELVSTGNITNVTAGDDAAVAVGDTVNPCPNVNAQWSLQRSNAAPDDFAFVNFTCATCTGDCNSQVNTCCNDNIPNVLTATVSGSCLASSFTLSLVWDGFLGAWVGYHPTLFAGHDIKLTLSCSGSTWTLQMTDSSPCVDDSTTATGTCNPLSLSGTLTGSGIGCCDGAGTTISVTITE